jgi:glycerol kinase
MSVYLLAIDQGTTNSRAIIFDATGRLLYSHEEALSQFFPQPGWVEQNPDELFQLTVKCCRDVLRKASLAPQQISAIGISNQRETTIIWDKLTGKAIYPAIVWQDRRTSPLCRALADNPIFKDIKSKTGLLLDPYFSATKIRWILDHVPNAQMRAEKGDLLFGTVDTYLLWQLSGGKSHATDATNASRTLLFNIHKQIWDTDILDALNIPRSLLPIVLDCAANFGHLDSSIIGHPIPITGIAGDQQAATIGQACFQTGMIKATYGTGCFMLMNTGTKVATSHSDLLATITYRLNGKITYGLEGSIFSAGTTIKWLRDTLKLIDTAAESETLARQVSDTGGVYLVPAFTGLGAPYWKPDARAAILGLTRNSDRAHIVRAALESVAYQTRDLVEAMQRESAIECLRVDGGMTANNWLLQFLADILAVPVEVPSCTETSALGAAYLAGLQIGVYQSLDDIALTWHKKSEFKPELTIQRREQLYQNWLEAIHRVI